MKILITGATSGIGYLTALTLSERNHEVYLTCHTEKEVKNVKDKVKDFKNINVMKLDITKEEDRLKVLNLDIDCLINNAAIGVGGSIIEADIQKVRENYEVNVFSTFRLIQLVLRQMVEKDKGRIINMSSLAGIFSFPFMGEIPITASLSFVNAYRSPLLFGVAVKSIL